MASVSSFLTNRATRASRNLPEAIKSARELYRFALRVSPRIIDVYELDISDKKLRSVIKEEFRNNAHVRDIALIDRLVFKGKQEIEEALMKWKTKPHVQSFIDDRLAEMQQHTKTQEQEDKEFFDKTFFN